MLNLGTILKLCSTLNFTSTANIQEVMKLFNLGRKSYQIDLSLVCL